MDKAKIVREEFNDSQKRERVKYGHESHGTLNEQWMCWREQQQFTQQNDRQKLLERPNSFSNKADSLTDKDICFILF
jgi:hypothetical protein